MEEAAPRAAPLQRLGPALRAVLGCDPKALRRAIDLRAAGDGGASSGGGKSVKMARELTDALDDIAAFLAGDVAEDTDSRAAAAYPAVDPMLEHVVRPANGGVAAGIDATAKSKKVALRIVAWLLAPSPRGAGDECAARVGAALARRCAPPTPKRTRLAACIALHHAAVTLVDGLPPSCSPDAIAPGLLATAAEAGEGDAPTRLQAEAADALLALTARLAVVDHRALWRALPHLRAVTESVGGWWPAACRAPRIAAREARTRLRRVEDTGDAEAWSRALANAWMDWAPLLAVRGGLDGITAGAVGRDTDGDAAGGGEVPSPSDGNGDESERDARRLARWLETAAAAASAERTGGPGATAAASERLAHALVAVGLLIGRAGLAGGGGESGDARARAALRNRAADALVPALGSRSGAARDLAASIAAATVGWGGWSAEHAALLDGSLAALDDASESESAGSGAGVASLAAVLVAAEPFASPGFGGTRPGLARVLRTCERGRTEDARVGALAVIRNVLETAAPGEDVVAGSEAAAIAAASLGALKDPTLIVRRAAAATFSALRIGDVLPRLLRALSAKDARERAAARESAAGAMRAYTETRGARAALDAFIAAVRPGSGEVDDAGDGDGDGVGGVGGDDADDAEGFTSRATSVLRGWSESLTEDQAREVAAGIAAATLRNPGVTAIVRVASALALRVGEPPACRETFTAVRAAWSASRPASLKSSETSANADDVFERLAPLLLLRTLPLEAWDDDHLFSVDESPSVPDVLLDIALAGADEYDEVRRVAAELHGRAHPDASSESRGIRLAEAVVDGRLGRARACMFSLCSSLAFRGIDACPSHSSTASPAATRAICARVLGDLGLDDSDQATKTRMGATETLASLVRAELEDADVDRPDDDTDGDGDDPPTGDESRGGRSEGGLLEPADAAGSPLTKSLANIYVDPLAAPTPAARREPLIRVLNGDDGTENGTENGTMNGTGNGTENGTDTDTPRDGSRPTRRRRSATLNGILAALEGSSAPDWTRPADGDPGAATRIRLTLADVLVSVARRPLRDADAAAAFANRALPALAAVAGGSGSRAAADATRAAALHVAMVAVAPPSGDDDGGFRVSGGGRVAPHARLLAERAASTLRTKSDGSTCDKVHGSVRVAAARLVTALVAGDDDTLEALAGSIPEVRSALRRAVDTAESEELADSCRRLLSCMGAVA